VAVTASAADDVGVVGVQFQRDGVNLGTEDTAAPYTRNLNTTNFSNGTHTLTAIARDADGNITTSSTITVTIDNAAPTASITAPTAGASVSGTVAVTANATDNIAVAGVQFQLDGVNLGAEDTASPYGVSWDTTTTSA
jgi:PKD repeat protein